MAPRRPRRRPRKGQMRMDAALDHMKVFGFTEDLIIDTVNELLEVYGENGWPFIEEDSYKVLLDAILEKVVGEAEKMGDTLMDDGKGGNNNPALMSGPLSGVHASTCSLPESTTISSQANEALDTLDTSSQTSEVPKTALQTNESIISKSPSPPHPHSQLSPEKLDALPLPRPPRHRPFHGWICRNNEDVDDLVTLPEAPLPKELQELFSRLRKRRWDVKPGDTH